MSDLEAGITISKRGPYKVEGAVRVLDAEGAPVETAGGKPFFLCRCGHSSNKPFCDGSHNRAEWDPTLTGI